MLHNPLYTSYFFLKTQALHLLLQKDTGGKKESILSLPWYLKAVAEELLLLGLCWEQGHPHTRGRRGSQPSEVAPVSTHTPALLLR